MHKRGDDSGSRISSMKEGDISPGLGHGPSEGAERREEWLGRTQEAFNGGRGGSQQPQSSKQKG